MNIIKKRLDKLPKNKVYKICQKMKIKCDSKDTKKKLCMRLLSPLFKYRMEIPSDIIRKIAEEYNEGSKFSQLNKDMKISVGKLPEREYIQYLINKGSSLPCENDFEVMIEDYVYDNEGLNYNPLYSIDDKSQVEIENMILEVLINIYEDNPEQADEIEERINEIGNKRVWAREKSRLIIRQIQEEKNNFLNRDFSGVDFSKIESIHTDLRHVDFSHRNLRNTNFSGADLRGADLRGADLRGADLRGADLRNTQNFETVFQFFEIENPEEDLITEDDLIQIDGNTKFPVGFDKENFTNYFS